MNLSKIFGDRLNLRVVRNVLLAALFVSLIPVAAEAKKKAKAAEPAKEEAKAAPADPAAAAGPGAAAPGAAAPTAATASAPKADDVPDAATACEPEMKSVCMGVVAGSERIAACLRTNKAKISPKCSQALGAFLKQQFMMSCASDMKKYCEAESHKQGGLMPCMQSHGAELSDGCKQRLGLSKPAAPAAAPAK